MKRFLKMNVCVCLQSLTDAWFSERSLRRTVSLSPYSPLAASIRSSQFCPFFPLFLSSFLCVLLPGKVNHHMTLCLSLTLALMSQVWGPQLVNSLRQNPSLMNLPPLIRCHVTLTGQQLLLKFKKDLKKAVCACLGVLPWSLETQGGGPRIGWAGMSRAYRKKDERTRCKHPKKVVELTW